MPIKSDKQCRGVPFGTAFAHTAGWIFAITGFAKIWSASTGTKVLGVTDPILGIEFRHLMVVVGMAELAIAIVCLFGNRNNVRLWLVAWLATNFLVYRGALWWMDWKLPCRCLGNLTDFLHISAQTADIIMTVLLTYLLVGSYGLLLWQWRERRSVTNKRGSHPASNSFSANLNS